MHTRSRPALAIIVAVGGLLAVSLAASLAEPPVALDSGTYRAGAPTTTLEVQPEVTAGNANSCPLGTFAYEFDVLDGGWFPDSETTVAIGGAYVRVYDNNSYMFSWESNVDIDLVVVKAGDAYDSFTYDSGARTDTGLHGPQLYNEPRGLWLDIMISHALFCTNSTIDVPDPLPPTVTNDVMGTYDAAYAWQAEKSVGATEPIRQPAGTTASVDYEVAYTRTGPTYLNGTVTGTATVTNPNTDSITLTAVTAVLSDGTVCTVEDSPSTLPPGDASIAFSCQLSELPPPVDLSHTVTVTWPDQTLTSSGFLPAGSATFDGDVPITVNDVDECATVSDSNTDTTVGGSICDTTTFTYSRSIDVEAGCFNHDNTADLTTDDTGTTASSSATVTVCGSQDLVVSKTAVPAFTRTYEWTIEKRSERDIWTTAGDAEVTWTIDVTKDAGTDSGFTVTGDITVYNPNDFDIDDVTVTDDATGGDCAVSDAIDVTIPALSSAEYGYLCTFDEDPGTGINVATASWDGATYATASTSATGTAEFDFIDPTTEVNGTIKVSDTSGDSWTLDSSGSVSYTTTYDDPAGTCTNHTNTATIDETDQSSTATTKVCVGADVIIAKTATTSYTRTYTWTISKQASPPVVKKIGGAATFGYTVIGSQTGFVDSEWTVSGTITVQNPNDWQAVDIELADSLTGCTLEETVITVAAGATTEVDYSCPLDSASDGTNTVTATWDADLADTPNSSAAADADYEFGAPTSTTNQTMTFTDTFASDAPLTLGTLTAADTDPSPTMTYNYTRTVSVPTWDCITLSNKASIVETGQTAEATVRVCGAARTGALTMGFWQNKNGQTIINRYCGGASGTSLATFLTGYNPFANLTATACKDLAAYTMNVIKAANASGASMNAMLTGQFLATALDVYFSSPSLGGNRIGAPTPIGGATVDLTNVCKNITGGCTILENTSTAFGGATSLTVLQLLAAASNQSNSGGTLWYGNIKATQELAKDTFDAINNQKAFSA